MTAAHWQSCYLAQHPGLLFQSLPGSRAVKAVGHDAPGDLGNIQNLEFKQNIIDFADFYTKMCFVGIIL